MAGLSPTQRTLRELRNQGRIAAIAERWIGQAGKFGKRKDLFGFVDVVALCPEHGIIGVQCCSGGDMAAHRKKIVVDCYEEAKAWLQAGGRIELWGWRKVKVKRGGKAMTWAPRVEVITSDHLSCVKQWQQYASQQP